MNIDEFVRATNCARYQRMLDESTDEAERAIIRKLLAEEVARQTAVRHRAERNATELRPEAPT